MKKTFLSLFITIISFVVMAQTKKDTPPKKVGKPLPNLTYYTAPDSLLLRNQDLSKDKPLLYMLFSPECSHCKHVTEEILQNIEHFKNVQILMVTWMPFRDLKDFYTHFHIADYPEITMAWTNDRSILQYYSVHLYPKLIIYNKHKEYIDAFEGSGDIDIENIWRTLKRKK